MDIFKIFKKDSSKNDDDIDKSTISTIKEYYNHGYDVHYVAMMTGCEEDMIREIFKGYIGSDVLPELNVAERMKLV